MQDGGGRSALSSSRLRSCALGCLAVVLVCIGLGIGLYFWAVTPGPQVPADTFVGSQTAGVAYVSGLHEDPAFAAAVEKILRTIQEFNFRRARQADIPIILRWLSAGRRDIGDRDVEKAIRDVPRDLAVLLERVPDASEPRVVVIANLNRFPRVLHLTFSLTSLFRPSETFAGYRILQLGPPGTSRVSFVEDTLIWAQDGNALRQVLERRSAPEASYPSTLSETLQSRDPRWNLFGTLNNRGNLLAWILQNGPQSWRERLDTPELESALAAVDNLDFGFDVSSDGSLEGFLNARLDSEEEAAQLKQLIEVEVAETGAHAALQLETGEDARELRGTFRLTDLADRIQKLMSQADRRRDSQH